MVSAFSCKFIEDEDFVSMVGLGGFSDHAFGSRRLFLRLDTNFMLRINLLDDKTENDDEMVFQVSVFDLECFATRSHTHGNGLS